MNASVPQSVIDEATELDPYFASSEYGGEFRSDVAAFVDRVLVENAVDRGVIVRPPQQGIKYESYTDPSGGQADSFTCAIAHRERSVEQLVIVDALLEIKAPFNPIDATWRVCELLREYGCTHTTGDKYAAQWVLQSFARSGITYRHHERDTSSLYLEALPLFSSGRLRLVESVRLVNQIASLERQHRRAGAIV
jgi:hypothetical protein